ncbi:MAG TPA: ParB/RepB/Spo0J family partition protein [Candidatus Paceibacterota bacterium]|nr:ParB/RepB/Spo0J family partition protein [Candidatus Paceibacterota bacterium]
MNDTTKNISLDLIDDPKLAMRSDVDSDDIEELCSSMREIGLVEPIVVRPNGERYEVIAGHRRTRAARILGWPVILAVIKQADDNDTLAMRLAENLSRHNVDPVDEACFIGEIMKTYSFTANDVAEKLKRRLEWVEERLEVFQMPQYMQQHLKLKKYPLGAALWISRIENEATKNYYANWAAINGVSVAGAKQWHDNLKATNFNVDLTSVEIKDEGGQVQQVVKMIKCAACHEDCELSKADSVWVHPTCH